MHFYAWVLVTGSDVELVQGEVDTIMGPFCEEVNKSGIWDWYQIGGRWTGVFDKAYNPEEDPKNLSVCFICKGTGERIITEELQAVKNSFLESIGEKPEDKPVPRTVECNGCGGTGKKANWPTQWVKFKGDIVPVWFILERGLENPVDEISDPDNGPVMVPYTFFSPEVTVSKEYVNPDFDLENDEHIKAIHSGKMKILLDTPDYVGQIQRVLEHNQDKFIVVVDYHS